MAREGLAGPADVVSPEPASLEAIFDHFYLQHDAANDPPNTSDDQAAAFQKLTDAIEGRRNVGQRRSSPQIQERHPGARPGRTPSRNAARAVQPGSGNAPTPRLSRGRFCRNRLTICVKTHLGQLESIDGASLDGLEVEMVGLGKGDRDPCSEM